MYVVMNINMHSSVKLLRLFLNITVSKKEVLGLTLKR